jgi:4-amino-4-deoxy-L-arabinose transferase-like glycosyltransferase
MNRGEEVFIGCVFLPQLLLFAFIALHRFIDADEGAYLLASRLILLHKKPYVDFFYNQAPLLPYIYAAWMKLAGVSWRSAKLFSALLTSVLGTLVYLDVVRRTRKRLAGAAAVILFASSTLIFAWFPIAKTYSLAGLLLFSAYLAVGWRQATTSRWVVAAGGIMFGLSVNTRSYLVLLLPVFLWWIFRNLRDRSASLVWFLAGFGAGLVPSLLLFLNSPDAFLFDNLRYHAMRSSEGLVGWWWEKFVISLELFLWGGEGDGLQWSMLFFVGFGLTMSGSKQKQIPRLGLQIGAILALICLLPTPAYVQYFCLCVPFLIVLAVCVVDDLLSRLATARERMAAGVICTLLLTAYIAAGANDLRRYLDTGESVPGVRAAIDKGDWKLARVIEVSGTINQIARSGEEVASFWPGDIFQTDVNPVSGFENPFGLPISEKLTSEQRAKYHILSPDEVKSDFAHHVPRVVVLRNQIISPSTDQRNTNVWDNGDSFRASLLGNEYRLARSFGGISIYVFDGNDGRN